MKAGMAIGGLLICLAGCDFLRGRRATPTPPPTPAAAILDGLIITAVPMYRLVVNPMLIDAPSRLLVLQIRIGTSLDRPLSVTPDDTALVLANGQRAPVFDRGRAMELLRRTTLADADLGYLQRPEGYVAGGLGDAARAQLSETITLNLLSEGAFTNEYPAQGYVIVDTNAPLGSLAGSSFEVIAYQLSDSAMAKGSYQFAGPAAAAAATDTSGSAPVPAEAAVPAAAAPPAETAPPAVETAPPVEAAPPAEAAVPAETEPPAYAAPPAETAAPADAVIPPETATP